MDKYVENRLYRVDGSLQKQAATYAFNIVENKHYEVEGSYNFEKATFATHEHALAQAYITALEKGQLADRYPTRRNYSGIQQLYNDRIHLLRENYIQQIKKERLSTFLTYFAWIVGILAFPLRPS